MFKENLLVKKIVVLRLSSLGDVVLATTIVESLRLKFPQARISFLVFKKYQELLKNNPHIENLITFNYSENLFCNFYSFIRILMKLRRDRFDLLIDLHPKDWCFPRTIFWSFLFGKCLTSKVQVKVKALSFKTIRNTITLGHGAGIHTIDLYKKSLSGLGINDIDVTPRVYISKKDVEFSYNYLVERNFNKDCLLIGLVPGASYLTKQWPEAKFIDLCKRLSLEPRANLIIFGDLKDKALIHRIVKEVNSNNIAMAINFDLNHVAALIAQCKVVVSNDSGLMHLATAFRIPVVAIFGPTHPQLGFAPWGDNNKVFYSKISCSPCSRCPARRRTRRSRRWRCPRRSPRRSGRGSRRSSGRTSRR
ncbi:MAG: glycosyltransferase family 9 protein, partial [Candidatus Omnitrophota bacterium]